MQHIPDLQTPVTARDSTNATRTRRRFLAAVPAVMTCVPAQATTAQSSATACITRGSSRAPSASISDSSSDEWMRVAVPVEWAKGEKGSQSRDGVTRVPRANPPQEGEFACLRTTDGRLWRLRVASGGFEADRLTNGRGGNYETRSAKTELYALLKLSTDGQILGLAFESNARAGIAVTTSCYTSAAPLRRNT